MDRFFSIHENWTIHNHPTTLAAYALWRLNFIHPFIEGNGRTARAACYYLICMKAGKLLGGRKTVPERIRENRDPYYAGLHAADHGWLAALYTHPNGDLEKATRHREIFLSMRRQRQKG